MKRILFAALIIIFVVFMGSISVACAGEAVTEATVVETTAESVTPETEAVEETEAVVETEATEVEVKTIKISHVGSIEDARNTAALMFKEIVENDTDGSIIVEVYPGSQLGGDRDAMEGVKLGTIQMTVGGAGIFANFEPKMGITALPFLFENFEQAWAFNDSDINQEANDSLLASNNMRVLAYWENGFRVVTNSVKPLNAVEDFAGLKLRTPENPIILETMKALGANPSPLPFAELFMALQQKAYDGQENPIPIIYNYDFYEVQPYLSITNHVYEPMPLVINEDFFKNLTSEQQEVIKTAAILAQNFNRNLIQQQTEEMLVKLEEVGMEISKPDLAMFKEATKDVRNLFKDDFGEKFIEDAYNFSK